MFQKKNGLSYQGKSRLALHRNRRLSNIIDVDNAICRNRLGSRLHSSIFGRGANYCEQLAYVSACLSECPIVYLKTYIMRSLIHLLFLVREMCTANFYSFASK